MAASANNPTTDVLELRAAEQRRRLHNSVEELRGQLREKLDLKRNAREYFAPAAAVVGLAGIVFGYGATAVFYK